MKYLYFLLLALIIPSFLKAQSYNKPGYVVDLKGDTLHGMINGNISDKTPSAVILVTNNGSTKTQYTINEAQGFGIYNQVAYKRFVISASQDIPGATTADGADTTVKQGMFFLKMLAAGKNVSLYAYTDNIKTRYYTSEQGLNLTELKYHEYRDPNNQGTVVKADYKIQLQKLAAIYQAGNQRLIDDIQTADYKDYKLVKIAVALNGGQDVQNVMPVKGGFRVLAGVNANFNTTSYTGESYDNLNGAKPYHSVSPQANIGIDYAFNREVQAVVLRAVLGISTGHVAFTNNYIADYAQPQNIDVEAMKYNQLNISLTPQILINLYNSRNFKFYIDGGFMIQHSSYSGREYTNTQNYGTTSTTVEQVFPPMSSIVYDIPLRAGIVINGNIELYGAYIAKSDYVRTTTPSIDGTTYQFGINYLFGFK